MGAYIMKKILFVNACVRSGSRTLKLAEYLLDRLEGELIRLDLEKEKIAPHDRTLLEKRERLVREGKFGDEMFRYAREFAQADEIVIAAPYWDLSFPALLKIYLEAVTVSGVTFTYEQGIPKGLCRAKRLFYVATAGGPVFADFGFAYVRTLAENFYGIRETVCFQAENLDVYGADVDALLKEAEEKIDSGLSRKTPQAAGQADRSARMVRE